VIVTDEDNASVRFVKHLLIDDDVALVVRAHLYIEGALTKRIEGAVPSPQHLNLEKMRFQAKLQLAAALNLIDDYEAALAILNTFRNRAAHRLRFTIDDTTVDQLREALPKEVRDRLARAPLMVSDEPRSRFRGVIAFLFAALDGYGVVGE
jgi:hypothetical protein